jgi:hypothetical protein
MTRRALGARVAHSAFGAVCVIEEAHQVITRFAVARR